MTRRLLLLSVALLFGVRVKAADNAQKAFTQYWQGRTVVLKRTLYSVVYDEHGRRLPFIKQQRRVSGLTMATPFGGVYYQFDALRESDEDIVDRDPNRVLDTLRVRYRRETLSSTGSADNVEPLVLVQYEPGGEFLVKTVQFQRDQIRILLYTADPQRKADLATALTVKWPLPLSSDFTESPVVDSLLRQFMEPRP